METFCTTNVSCVVNLLNKIKDLLNGAFLPPINWDAPAILRLVATFACKGNACFSFLSLFLRGENPLFF